MFYGLVEIPREVLDAQENGTLVIFAGAGISMDSGLPDFKGLAAQIGRGSGLEYDENKWPDLPDYLSELKNKHKIDVHAKAEKILTEKQVLEEKSPKPNKYFNLIPCLFKDAANLRIVTTNFDTLLLKGANKRFGSIEKQVFPKLPTDDNFNSIVFLHGCCGNQKPPLLLLTNEDFLNAYMNPDVGQEALRFLRKLWCSQFTVVFIGYGLNDILIHEMVKGLKNEGVRKHIFARKDTPVEDIKKLKKLDIAPIYYSPPKTHGGVHEELLDCLEEWVSRKDSKNIFNQKDIGPSL